MVFCIRINLDVVNPQRTFNGYKYLTKRFLQPVDKNVSLDFKRIIEEFEKDINNNKFISPQNFDISSY